MSNTKSNYLRIASLIFLGTVLILFTQWMKTLRYPDALPITSQTFVGLATLWAFSMIGVIISDVSKKTSIRILQDFPTLGWVSITSLVFCLMSNYFVDAIKAVDFLSITTPILAFAGFSVADSLSDLKSTSWRVAIVAVFVFIGTYLGSALLAQLGLMLNQ